MGALSLLFGILRSCDDLEFSSIFGFLGGLAVFLGDSSLALLSYNGLPIVCYCSFQNHP